MIDYKYVAGVLVGIVVALVGFFGTNYFQNAQQVRAIVENEVEKCYNPVEKRLTRIEDKLDQVLMRLKQ